LARLINVLTGTLRGSGLNISRLGALALDTAPRFWERFSQDRKRSIIAAPHRPNPALWDDVGLHAAWLGHSTVLLKIEGVTIITDPVFSSRVGLNFGPVTLGLKRIVAPALLRRETPQPDIVLLSHAHMDHFDLPSLRSLESSTTAVVTASRTSDLLRIRNYGRVQELAWGEQVRLEDVTVRAFQVNHWGARMRSDTFRGFNGYVIETPRHRVLFGGDTAVTDSFRSVRTPRGIDLAIMPIGAYNPWIRAHCTPEQAFRMAEDAGADCVLPVHHQTFQLSNEPYLEPIERLVAAAGNNPERVALTSIGQEFHFR
jgi:L-ascorbate metabolism protein UlaG (beta-lactamase superfamily)